MKYDKDCEDDMKDFKDISCDEKNENKAIYDILKEQIGEWGVADYNTPLKQNVHLVFRKIYDQENVADKKKKNQTNNQKVVLPKEISN